MLVSPTSIQLSWFVSHLHQYCISFIKVTRFASQFPQGPISSRSRDMCLNSKQVPSHPRPGLDIWIWPPPRLLNSRLISIHVASHLNPGHQNCISAPSKHHHNPIQDSRYVFRLHPGPISSGSGYKYSSLTSIYVRFQPNLGPYSRHHPTLHPQTTTPTPYPQAASQLHLGPDIHISPQSRSRLTSIHVWRCMAHLYPCPVSPPTRPSIKVAFHLKPYADICISPPSRWCITSMKFPIFASELHPDPISKPSKSHDVCLTSIQALSYIRPSYRILVSPPSKYHIASIQVPIFASQLHPGADICVWHLTTSWDVLLISIHVQSHHHLGLEIWVSPPSMSRLISIQALIFASHLIPCWIRYLNSIQVPKTAHELLPGHISNPSRYQNVDVKCVQVLSNLHPGTKILVSPTSMYCLTSIQVPRFHLGPNISASPPSRSCITSIQATSHFQPSMGNCISTPL